MQDTPCPSPVSSGVSCPSDQSSIQNVNQYPIRDVVDDWDKFRNWDPRVLAEIPEAPVFRPTLEEFKDPMAYIRSIWLEGGKAGICKIIPPKEWNSYSSIPDNVQFSTRLQKLHMLRHRHRGLNERFRAFVESHFRIRYRGSVFSPRVIFYTEVENNRTKIEREVDLFLLYAIVHLLGGYDRVCAGDQWHRVASLSKLPRHDKNVESHLKHIFMSCFEHLPPSEEVFKMFPIPESIRCEIFGNTASKTFSKQRIPCSPSSECCTQTDIAGRDCSRSDHRHGHCLDEPFASSRISVRICAVCFSQIEQSIHVAVCAICGITCHPFCFPGERKESPVSHLPAWICHGGCSFGFDCGGSFTLAEYRAHAREFMRSWYQGPSDSKKRCEVSWSSMEAEYWRIVENPCEAVCVRYGSDIDTDDVGSGFPRLSKAVAQDDCHRRGPQLDPWNLNILPSVCGSLLKYLPNNIKGITAPWLYCGSLFSTFCYHAEDLNLMSINYMHAADEGSGKLWYGVPPGSGALRFEAALRTSVPEIFEFQPDLQYELVTMVSPVELRDRGASIYRTVQRPGEFILTFPQSYHGGFSLGFNIGEAVNFFTPECFPWMRAGMMRCHVYRRPPVFCVSEFLVCIARRLGAHADLSVHDATLIASELSYIVDSEETRRHAVQKSLCGHYRIVSRFCRQGIDCCLCRQPCYLSVMEKFDTKEPHCLDCVTDNYSIFIPSPSAEDTIAQSNRMHCFLEMSNLHNLKRKAEIFCSKSGVT